MFKKKYILIFLVFITIVITICYYIYLRDRNKFEPKLWIGMFDYRLNFRDVGVSLNQCLNKEVFQQDKFYRSNRYFSGWSCKKIENPDKIYSLDYSPWNPHAYYCNASDGKKIFGYHSNTDFEISDIENLSNWEKPQFQTSMCIFIRDNINDLIDNKRFLYHCDMGRDRTGAYTALFVMLLAEQRSQNTPDLQNAIECDYEKTPSLEKHKIGRMKNFMVQMSNLGGVSQFIQNKCGIDSHLLKKASDRFYK